MSIEPWQLWVVAGILALVIEMITPDMIVGSLGFGCFSASITAFVGGGVQPQLVTFIATTFLVMVGLRPVVKRVIYRGTDEHIVGVQSLIGQQGVVVDSVSGGLESGRVKLGGEEWRALSQSGQALEEGTRVVVVQVEGNSVVVKASHV